jgi:hypothetical protein
MSAEKPNSNGSQQIGADFRRLIDNREWDKAIELLTPAPEEAGRQAKSGNGDGHRNVADLIRAIENRDWKALDQLTGFSPEEAERILREEPTIDGDDFDRLLDELDRREAGVSFS